MVLRILDIGNARYRIDRSALKRFMLEAQESAAKESLDAIFDEVMGLYGEYAVTGKLDVLMKLKCKLEQVSLRYKSLELAEEVLNINSCLPYEWRVGSCDGHDPAKDALPR